MNPIIELPKQPYNREIADELYTKDRIAGLKYIQQYIFHCYYPTGYLFWDAADQLFRRYTTAEIKDTFIPKSEYIEIKKVKKYTKIGDTIENEKELNDKTKIYTCIKDFDRINILYKCVCEVDKPLIYYENGTYYLNLFFGIEDKYKIYKKYEDFDEETKEKTQALLNHIKMIWCSNDEKVYQFILKWIAYLFHFKQTEVGLYLKSGQGTGKGTITNLLLDIMGNVGCSTQKKKVVTNWNAQLAGKSLFVIEEIGFVGTSEWKEFSGTLKTYITEPNIDVEDKGKSIHTIKNHLNVIINSNWNAVNIETDDRRWCILDISNERQGDKEYFGKLKSYVKNEDVKICFYKFFDTIEILEDEHLEPPLTKSKKDLINDNLHPILKFIKQSYILQKRSINSKLCDLYEEFKYSNTSNKQYTIINFNKLLRETFKSIDDNNKIYKSMGIEKIKYTFEKLYDLYKNKEWIHETDEFITDKTTTDLKEDEDNEEMKTLKDENEKLKEEIERLKKLLNEKEKPKEIKKEEKKPIKEEDIEIIDDDEIIDDIEFNNIIKKPKKINKKYKAPTKEQLEKNKVRFDFEFDEEKKKGKVRKTQNIFNDDDLN